jgi:tetratricopeptide (TPR) repeat protein
MSQVESLLQQYANQGPWERGTSDGFRRVQTIILTHYGDLQRARNLFQSWAKDTQNLFWVHYGQGWIDIREGKFDDALDQFEKALLIKPQEAYVVRDLGQAFFMKGDREKAIQQLGKASILDPRDANTAFFLGRAYQEKGENLLALENFQRALKLGSEGEELYYYLGMVYGNLNNLGQAHYHFGKSFLAKGDKVKALFHFKTALKYVEKDPIQKDLIDKEIKALEPGKEKEKKSDRNKKGQD